MPPHKATEKHSINSIYNDWNDGFISIPSYQRGKVWTLYQKQLLIDSLLRGIDIPKIYFDVNQEAGEDKYEVVDGQQRISAIIEFLNGEFKLNIEFDDIGDQVIKGKKMEELPRPIQRKLNSINLDVVELREYSEDEVREIFIRHQEGSPLNAAEKRRAYPGNCPSIIEGLAEHPIFSIENFLGFNDKRYSYQDSCAKIFHQISLNSITTIKPDDIKKTYKTNQDIDSNSEVVRGIKRCFNILKKCLGGKSPKLKKYELLRLTYLIKNFREHYVINNFESLIGDAYIKFQLDRKEDRENNDVEDQKAEYVAFNDATRGDSVSNQKFIHETLSREIIKRVPSLKRKDSIRVFSEDQRWVIFQKSNGKCQGSAEINSDWYVKADCSKTIKYDDFHADHIERHDDGGETKIENGQALCAICNLKKG